MYSYTNQSACLLLLVVKGFASTYFVECAMAIAKNFKRLEAVGKGLRMLTPQCVRSYSCRSPLRPLCLLHICYDHWLLGCVAALMLSVKVMRYIIRISPCISALLSVLKKGRDLSARLDRKRLRAAIHEALYALKHFWLFDVSDRFYLRRVNMYALISNEIS
nr:hypothetical protein [Tanacetum cinerariifolium]